MPASTPSTTATATAWTPSTPSSTPRAGPSIVSASSSAARSTIRSSASRPGKRSPISAISRHRGGRSARSGTESTGTAGRLDPRRRRGQCSGHVRRASSHCRTLLRSGAEAAGGDRPAPGERRRFARPVDRALCGGRSPQAAVRGAAPGRPGEDREDPVRARRSAGRNGSVRRRVSAGVADAASALEPELERIAAEVDALFSELLILPADPREQLYAAMRYAAIGGGKRLRPLLVVAAASLFHVDRERALRVGVAVEAIHVYSLIHDDLP